MTRHRDKHSLSRPDQTDGKIIWQSKKYTPSLSEDIIRYVLALPEFNSDREPHFYPGREQVFRDLLTLFKEDIDTHTVVHTVCKQVFDTAEFAHANKHRHAEIKENLDAILKRHAECKMVNAEADKRHR